MNRFALIAFTLAVALTSHAEPLSLPEINRLLGVITAANRRPPDNSLEEAALDELPEFLRLQVICKEHPVVMADNLGNLTEGDGGASLVLRAMQGVPAGVYMAVLEKLPGLISGHRLGVPVLLESLSPKGRMQGFLADNYRHPRVVAFLNALRPTFAGQEEGVAISDLLAGKTTTRLNAYRVAYARLPEGRIPKILLQ